MAFPNYKSILQDTIRQRLCGTQLGDQACGKLVAQQRLSDSAIELAAIDHYNQLASGTIDFELNDRTGTITLNLNSAASNIPQNYPIIECL